MRAAALFLPIVALAIALAACERDAKPDSDDPGPTPTVAPTATPTAVPLPVGEPEVRVLYVVPNDRAFRDDYAGGVASALESLQLWYRDQMNGKTFALHSGDPERCVIRGAADEYLVDTWDKVMADVQACAPVAFFSSTTVWVLYVDVVHQCDAPGRLGAGTSGVTIMPRQDMDGLIGARYFDDCGVEYVQPIGRYIGGAGHELGHALGLSHPPECEAGSATCDPQALMWLGYLSYPQTYLLPADKAILDASPFIR